MSEPESKQWRHGPLTGKGACLQSVEQIIAATSRETEPQEWYFQGSKEEWARIKQYLASLPKPTALDSIPAWQLPAHERHWLALPPPQPGEERE